MLVSISGKLFPNRTSATDNVCFFKQILYVNVINEKAGLEPEPIMSLYQWSEVRICLGSGLKESQKGAWGKCGILACCQASLKLPGDGASLEKVSGFSCARPTAITRLLLMDVEALQYHHEQESGKVAANKGYKEAQLQHCIQVRPVGMELLRGFQHRL